MQRNPNQPAGNDPRRQTLIQQQAHQQMLVHQQAQLSTNTMMAQAGMSMKKQKNKDTASVVMSTTGSAYNSPQMAGKRISGPQGVSPSGSSAGSFVSQQDGSGLASPTPRPKTPQLKPNQPVVAAPQSMEEAMAQFHRAKEQTQKRIKHKQSATTRLINAMADLIVCLLTRAMQEGVDHELEIRLYKKPLALTNGKYAVAEYRDSSKDKLKLKEKEKSKKDMAKAENTSDDDFQVVATEELLPGDPEKDSVDNWKQFFEVVKSMSKWWRLCLAVHKRIGWSVKLERSSVLNMIDGRVLGYNTIKIRNFI